MAEITRAMKPGRKLLASVLLVWDEHEVHYDCVRYTSNGLKSMFKNNNLTIKISIKDHLFSGNCSNFYKMG